ncbi:MAG: TlyA family RNA methyltransferase [Defluviitaleaceae bacterium]|nr:TlyA family RNA methyltransferase [Defluviitaleaceae bacterium]
MSKRLDVIVCGLLGVSREYAKELIQAGKVAVDGGIVTKSGVKLPENVSIYVDGGTPKFVSRGGFKLEKAIDTFGIDLRGLNCLDIGAATGGFTDCMLQNGANVVLAVENGHGQMAEKLLADPRVICREGLDIRDLTADDMPFIPQFIAVDLSFISITLVLPKIAEFLAQGKDAVLLIKPQFEVGRSKVGKNGVVKNPKDHITTLKSVCEVAKSHGLVPVGLDFSPIKGQNGNIEYLMQVTNKRPNDVYHVGIEAVVDTSFKELV